MNISRNLTGNALVKYKKELKLTSYQKDIIVGTLLGDASMRLSGGKPVYAIKFEQGIQHKQYLEHLYQIFESYCGTGPRERFIDKEKKENLLGLLLIVIIILSFIIIIFIKFRIKLEPIKKIKKKESKLFAKTFISF